jgi:hypothetical protein
MLGSTSPLSITWQTRDALKTSRDRTAKIVKVYTIPKSADPFGQVIGGELILLAPFSIIDQLPPVYSKEDQWIKNHTGCSSNSPLQRLIYTTFCEVNRQIWEFYQQHKPHDHQHFAIVEIVRWKQAPSLGKRGMDFLLLESTGHIEGQYRRIGHFMLRELDLPKREHVEKDAYKGMVLQHEAFKEAFRAEWPKRTVSIV